MAYSTLKQKTPLKAKSRLQSRTPLKAKSELRRTKRTPAKKSMYKPKYAYKSILTTNLDTCYITGATKSSGSDIHIHHIFRASNKANSEKYGFIVPLRADWHNMSDYGVHFNKELDLKLKHVCQEYFLNHYGEKEDFIKIFGKWW